jgi:hypothetical protein
MVLNYAMSASGQMRARITSQSNAAALYIDDCFAGEADNVATGSFASDYQSYTPGTNVTKIQLQVASGDALVIH